MSVTLGDHGLRSEAERRLEGVATAGGKFVNVEMGSLASVVESFAGRTTVRRAMDPGLGRYNTAVLAQELITLRAARPGTSVTFITDPNGRLIAGQPEDSRNVGMDFSFRDWYIGVRDSGNTYISDAFVSAAPGAPQVLAVTTPIRSEQGDVLGYIGANYGMDALQNLMNDLARSQDADLTVLDSKGNIVAAPGGLPQQLTSLNGDRSVQLALTGERAVLETMRGDRNVFAAYAPIDRLGWAIIAETPSSSALEPVQSLRVAILTSAAVLGLVMIVGLILLIVSLRERARVSSELEKKESETRAILNASTDAYITMNEDGVVTAWSDRAESTFGWTSEEAVGRTVADLIIPDEFRQQHWDGIRRYMKTGQGAFLDSRVEVEALHKNGHRFPLELAVWVVRSGNTVVFNAFCHDITERRKASDELAAARDEALEASRLKSEFVANMSHEIRTPMNGVLGMTSLLLHTNLSEEQREYTETISHSAEALLDVINDILDFSKIEAGRMDLDCSYFEMRPVVEAVGEIIAGAAESKGLELTVAIEPDVPYVLYGDANRLRQILLNFVGNAVKFTDKGEVSIRCELVETEGECHTLRFEVRDTGIGIRPQDQGRLFQSFSQVDTSSSRSHGGTGLGLIISKRLVELMNGEVGFTSEPGAGSTFWFTGRFEEGPAGIELPTNEESDQVQNIAGMRVLVVDDNATNRMILQKTLESWDVKCALTSGAREALFELGAAYERGEPYQVAIIDYNMPEIDGLELGRQMRTDPRFESTKKILLTSSGQRGESTSATNGGFSGYLTKPVKQSSLLDAIVDAVPGYESTVERIVDISNNGQKKPLILIAEDNAVNQNVTRQMLVKMGYTVEVVSNGRDALEAMESRRYDAVLMDCQMPVVDGYEATLSWREREPAGQHLPIIAVTAHAMKGDAGKCFEAGMDAYVSKPITWDSLEAALKQWAPLTSDT